MYSIYVCMYVCMYQELLKTTTNSLCVCAHLANKADSDSAVAVWNYFCCRNGAKTGNIESKT